MTERHTSPVRDVLRIGTRGSRLARWQAEWVAGRLQSLGHAVEILEITTRGDAEQIVPVATMGSPGIFTKEIQRALLAGEIDFAVHSLKDLPTDSVEGLVLAAVPERESPADVLVGAATGERRPASPSPIDVLQKGARVGTGSLRRQAQLLHVRPDLRISDVRGNVDTRLRKLDDGEFDALVLAEAGLRRLGFVDRVSEVLPFSLMLPAVGQGALAIECRVGDARALAAVESLNHGASRAAVIAERALLAHLRGGCLAPVGAWGRIESGTLHLSAAVLSADGVERIDANGHAASAEADLLGRRVAESLLARGAESLIAAARES